MRRFGLALVVSGLALALGSFVLLPSTYGSDYAAINPYGIFGGVVGVVLAIAGLAPLIGGDSGPGDRNLNEP